MSLTNVERIKFDHLTLNLGIRDVVAAAPRADVQRIEASIDLMRQVPDAPPGTMDFLFAKLMLHFKEQGYQRFGLGMAPMSGISSTVAAAATPAREATARWMMRYNAFFIFVWND